MAESDPLNELLRVQKRMNELCETAMARTEFETHAGVDSWTPVADVYDTPDGVVVCLELPGLEQEKIDVRLDGESLVVEGGRHMEPAGRGGRFHRVERSYGKFVRRFGLPAGIDRDGVNAAYQDGVLLVRLPRQTGEDQTPRRVAIG